MSGVHPTTSLGYYSPVPVLSASVSASLSNGSPRHTPPGRSNSAIDATAARRASVRQQYSQRGRLGQVSGAGTLCKYMAANNIHTFKILTLHIALQILGSSDVNSYQPPFKDNIVYNILFWDTNTSWLVNPLHISAHIQYKCWLFILVTLVDTREHCEYIAPLGF